ncbi:MAG: class A beta-lactamase-related serine hydrolase [Thermoleophilia bacterium]|nr:class A beta-lactamase-related serine hydrolase [Thermoleophilia bacterium]
MPLTLALPPPPPPRIAPAPVVFGHVTAQVGARTRVLEAQADGRIVARLRPARGPRRIAVPLPAGEHALRLRARGPGGSRWSATRRVWVLPRSGRRPGRLGGRVDPRLQAEVDRLVGGLPAVAGVWAQHLATGCGAARNAGAAFPAASTLKVPILLEALRRARGRPGPGLAALLDRMVIDSDDRAANTVLVRIGGGDPFAGAAAVTRTMARIGMGASVVRAPYTIEDPPRGEQARPLVVAAESTPELFTNYVTTPRDLGQMMLAVHQGALGRGPVRRLGLPPAVVRREVTTRLLGVRDATKLAQGVPSGVPLAHKTGFTRQVKHDAGIAYLRRGPILVVVMTWSRDGVDDATGDPFIARVGQAAVRRLQAGGRC